MKNKQEGLTFGDVFVRFSPMSYPGRIYGMYVWDWNKNKYIIDEVFCKKHGIVIKKLK